MKTLRALTIQILLVSGLVSHLMAETEAGNLWETRRFLHERMELNAVASDGAGHVITVGVFGTIRRSTDGGLTWSNINSGTGYDLQDIMYTGSEWIAVGGHLFDQCIILKSTDGISWSQTCLGDAPDARCVTQGTPGVVALGRNELIAFSPDATAWKTSTNPEENFYDVVWTGAFYAGVGTDGLIQKSTDGMTWTPHDHGGDSLYGVAWNGTRLIAVGRDSTADDPLVLQSTNGTTWTQVTTPSSSFPNSRLSDVVWTGSRFIAVGATTIYTSPDGLIWSSHSLPSGIVVGSLVWTGTRLVGVGASGVIVTCEVSAPDETSDWTVRNPGTKATSLQDLTMADVSGTQRIVLVGLVGTILTSDDNGFGYVDRSLVAASSLNAVTSANFAPRKFLIVGSSGSIYTSPDGITWTSRASGTTERLYGVVWHFPVDFPTSPAVAIAVGSNGTIRGSADGVAWSSRTSGTTEDLEDVASGVVVVGKPLPVATRKLVAVGRNGTVLSSSSGSTWTARASGTTDNLYGITTHDSKFVAVGGHGVVLTSADGENWTVRNTGTPHFLYDVKSTGTQLIAVGEGAVVFTSPNGINWTRRYTPYSHSLNAVHPLQFDNVGAVSINNVVITSEPVNDFSDWMDSQSPPAGQDDPADDPNNDRIVNAAAYGHGLDAVDPIGSDGWERLPTVVERDALGRFQLQIRTSGTEIPDLTYIVDQSTTMQSGSWTEVLRRAPGQPCATGPVHIISDGPTNTATLIFPGATGHSEYYTRFRYEIE